MRIVLDVETTMLIRVLHFFFLLEGVNYRVDE
jgi:hypothetical protein